MSSSGASFDSFWITSEFANSPGYMDTTGRSRRSPVINSEVRNLVLINAGQSNAINILPSAVSMTDGPAIDNFNIYDGGLYSPAGKALGTNDGANGAIIQIVADLLISRHVFDRVIIVPIGISGTAISIWSDGGVLADRIPLAVRRLASRGIAPGVTGVQFGLLWMQGEADNSNGTTQSDYQTLFGQVKANAIAAGFDGRILVPTETWDAGTTSAAIQAAQAAVRNGAMVFDGGNLDSITNAGRQDGTHFDDVGGSSAAVLICDAMHASGPPF